VASFRAITVAPGTTAPVASLTDPVIPDVPVWAMVTVVNKRNAKINADFDMGRPPIRLDFKGISVLAVRIPAD
jgi:hypothetical protein